MVRSASIRWDVVAALSVALLAGCGGAEMATSAAAPHGATPSITFSPEKSWMSGSTGGDLLYVSDGKTSSVYIFTFPGGKKVGTLTNLPASGLCSDSNGNVWIPNAYNGYVLEYAHGGTSPISTLHNSGYIGTDCSVDPKTGDLAVADYYGRNVAIFTGAEGAPTYYDTGIVRNPEFVRYANADNLFAASSGHVLSVLHRGSSTFKKFQVHPNDSRHTGLQYDGQYLTDIGTDNGVVNRYEIMRSKGNRAGKVKLSVCCGVYFWIHASSLLMPMISSYKTGIYVFKYPGGREPTKIIKESSDPIGVTVSVAPSRR